MPTTIIQGFPRPGAPTVHFCLHTGAVSVSGGLLQYRERGLEVLGSQMLLVGLLHAAEEPEPLQGK